MTKMIEKMLDPCNYAAKTRSEHSEQVALFMWANMAMNFGFMAASDDDSYNVAGFAKSMLEKYDDKIPKLKWLFAISNHGAGFGRKAEGVKKGVADIFLPVAMFSPHSNENILKCVKHGLYLELKRLDSQGKKAGVASVEQLEFQTDMRKAGYAHEIVFGWEQARDAILLYLGKPGV